MAAGRVKSRLTSIFRLRFMVRPGVLCKTNLAEILRLWIIAVVVERHSFAAICVLVMPFIKQAITCFSR